MNSFDIKKLEKFCDDPTLWKRERDNDFQTYELRIKEFSVWIWKNTNGRLQFLTNRYLEDPTYHLEVYRDTGRPLERHALYKAHGEEVRSLYDRIVEQKEREYRKPVLRVQEREPECLRELEDILEKREKT